MRKTTIAFTDYLEQRGYKFESIDGGEDYDIVLTDWTAEKIRSISVRIFMSDCDMVAKVFSIAVVPNEKRNSILEKFNELHNKWRWINFYIDEDNEITARIEAVFCESNVVEVCDVMLSKIINITDECYPELMKVLW